MANPTGKGGRRFPKGVSGNPGGAKKQDPHIVAFKETTYKDFVNNLQKYGSLTTQQMTDEIQRKDITMFEKIFGRIVLGAATGDKDARNVLLDRLWGKVKQNVEYTDMGESDRARLQKLSMQELKELVKNSLKEDK